MIDTAHDTEGIGMAIAEILERDFQTGRIAASLEHASPESRDRQLASVPPLTFSPGYARVAAHLMRLESEHAAGIPFGPLAAWEAAGLAALHHARNAHHAKHPACGSCGVRQPSRFLTECTGCGAKFRRKK